MEKPNAVFVAELFACVGSHDLWIDFSHDCRTTGLDEIADSKDVVFIRIAEKNRLGKVGADHSKQANRNPFDFFVLMANGIWQVRVRLSGNVPVVMLGGHHRQEEDAVFLLVLEALYWIKPCVVFQSGVNLFSSQIVAFLETSGQVGELVRSI